MGKVDDLVAVVHDAEADAVAMADILHYQRSTIGDIRGAARAAGIAMRAYEPA
jgi:cyclase